MLDDVSPCGNCSLSTFFTVVAAPVLAAGLVPVSLSAQAGVAADSGAAGGERPAPYVVERLTGPIEVDGRVGEAAWEAIDPLPATVHSPTFRGEPTAATEFRVAYDDRYLYASCRAYVNDPSQIRAPSLERDDGSFTNDWCVINLDTYDDNETAWVFGTSPAGIRTDAVFPGDGTAGSNFTWSTFWDAATSRDGDGWYAEIRIPLSSLRFQPEPGTDRVVMGVAMWRNLARANEVHVWPAIPPRWGFPISFLKASRFRDAVFTGIEPRRPLYVTPYVLGGHGRVDTLSADGTGYLSGTETVRDAGLDAKVSLASNLTLDVTVNTDFAQVEADNQQVNLSRFSLFFPEKRQFFQERAALFDFSLGGVDRLFHSRRIGIVDGQQVPIHGGARLTGRLGPWELGVLDMQTAATALAPSENMGVLRLRRRVLNPNSYVGGILTTRIAEAGRGTNVVYGLDAVIRVAGQDYLTVNAARSHDDPDPDPAPPEPDAVDPGLAEASLLRLAWSRRGVDGFTYGAEMVRAGAAFDPDLGFLRRRDYTSAGAEAGYGWRPGEASPVLRHGPRVGGSVFTRNDDGTVETVQVQPEYTVTLKSRHTFEASVDYTYENLAQGFGLPDGASVPAGEYRFATGELSYSPPLGALLRANARVEAGGFFDGRIVAASLSPAWNASRHLELGGTYRIDAVTLPARDQSFTAHIARLRTRVMFSTQVSTLAFVQWSSTADRVAANLRFRYNPSEGHDLYIVWNEGLVTGRHRFDPVPPLSVRRTLLIKYSRTFTFGL